MKTLKRMVEVFKRIMPKEVNFKKIYLKIIYF